MAVTIQITIHEPVGPDAPERIEVTAPGVRMDDALAMIHKAATFLMFQLVRNTIMNELKGTGGPRVIIPR